MAKKVIKPSNVSVHDLMACFSLEERKEHKKSM